MLERLLAILAQGGLQTPQGLARQLGVSPLLVDMMLGDLEQRGFVKQAGLCQDACGGCDLASDCKAGKPQQRMWAVRVPPAL